MIGVCTLVRYITTTYLILPLWMKCNVQSLRIALLSADRGKVSTVVVTASSLIIVWVWNSSPYDCNYTDLASLIPLYFAVPPRSLSNKGVNDFAFVVGTSVEAETRQPCFTFWLSLEYGIVMYSIFLHLFLSSFTNPSSPLRISYIAVSHLSV